MNTIQDIPKADIDDLSTKTLMVVDNGLFIEIAKTLSKSFKRTLYYSPWKSAFPKSNQWIIGHGIEGIERVHHLFDHIDEVDIFVFPDIYDGDLQLHLESLGKLVFGGRKGEEMELYRESMKEHMKKLGLYVHPYRVITGVSALRDFLKENDNVWVKQNVTRGDFESFHSANYEDIEPVLDQLEHDLGAVKKIKQFIVEDAYDNAVETGMDGYCIEGEYPSRILAGVEIKDCGYCGRVVDYDTLPECISDYNEKTSSTMRDFGYRGFVSTEIRVSKHSEPYMVDKCYSDDTEVLTSAGWKLFKDCAVEDMFATLNTENGEIEYQYATRYVNYHYSGKMIELTNNKKSIECLVTPDHQILRTDRYKKKIFKERADSLTDKGFIPRSGIWNPKDTDEFFTLPAYNNEWDWNKTSTRGLHYTICTKVVSKPDLKIKMLDWAAFMGWYLSEGSTHSSVNGIPSTTAISQTKYVDEVKSVLDRLPFKYKYNGKSFRISCAQLTSYLKQYGLCDSKFVPSYIKNATPEVIREFLYNFRLGDGSLHKGNNVYYTTSKTLANDIQELIFKCGNVANILHKKTAGTITNVRGEKYERRYDTYVLYERNNFKDYWFETQKRKDRYIKEVEYNGMVHCLTVPNGTLYVRRNGKPLWGSNCARSGSPPNELYQVMYTNLADIVYYGAKGYVIDPIVEEEYGVEALIHSSWADKNWQAISFPKKYRDNIKLRNACRIDGKYYCAPQSSGLVEIGAVVATGKSMEEAIEKAKKIADSVSGHYIEIKLDSFDKAQEEFEKLEKMGIRIL